MAANFLLNKAKGKKRNRDNEPGVAPDSSTHAAPASNSAVSSVLHFPSSRPFPIDLSAPDFPQLKYQSREFGIKTAIHWGQRKLFLSELQLLIYHTKPGVSYHIVYAGSAPGTHLKALDALFSESHHTWELVDPGQFDRTTLGPLSNFKLRNAFFTNAVAYEIAAERLAKTPALRSIYEFCANRHRDGEAKENGQGDTEAAEQIQESLQQDIGNIDVARMTSDIPSMYEPHASGMKKNLGGGLNLLFSVAMEKKPLLFVSDIRSGSPNLPNFEEHVAENMRAQQVWTEILEGNYSLLKFRLPYTSSRGVGVDGGVAGPTALLDRWGPGSGDGTVEYVNGNVLLPIWTRPTSTEGRLVVKAGALRRPWSVAQYEDQLMYFNAILRERVHFNHALAPHLDLDGHYDSAAEVELWTRYLEHKSQSVVVASGGVVTSTDSKVSSSYVKSKVATLIQNLSSDIKGTFAGAIAMRERLMLGLTRGTHSSGQAGLMQQQLEEAADARASGGNQQSGDREKRVKEALNNTARERSRPVWLKNVEESEQKQLVPPSSSELDFNTWGCLLLE